MSLFHGRAKLSTITSSTTSPSLLGWSIQDIPSVPTSFKPHQLLLVLILYTSTRTRSTPRITLLVLLASQFLIMIVLTEMTLTLTGLCHKQTPYQSMYQKANITIKTLDSQHTLKVICSNISLMLWTGGIHPTETSNRPTSLPLNRQLVMRIVRTWSVNCSPN